jgi:beta-xylosidase
VLAPVFLVVVLALGAGTASATFARPSLVAPSTVILNSDAPDPSVVVQSGQYTVFTTQSGRYNVPVWTSGDLRSLRRVADALPVLPSWAQPGYAWAPSVARLGNRWVMYFSDAVRGKTAPNGQPMKCLGVATATDLTGPYTPRSQPILCDIAHGGDIDPSVYVDPAGTPWLISKRDANSMWKPTVLESRQLAPDGLSFRSGAYPLLQNNPRTWEGGVIEGPSMTRIGGALYLLYSGGDWTKSTYSQGAAICSSPRGGCRRSLPVLDRRIGSGPGGGSAFPLPNGHVGLAFHTWQGSIRVLHVADLQPGAFGVLFAQAAAPSAAVAHSSGRWGSPSRR